MTDRDDTQPVPHEPPEDRSEPGRTPFARWLDAARPKAALWRTVVGTLVIVLIWSLWSALVIGVTLIVWSLQPDPPDRETMYAAIASGETPLLLMVMLVTFFGLWFGVWTALRLVHGGQKTRTLFAPEGRVRWREFNRGMAIIAVYLAVSILFSIALGNAPYRSDLSLASWALYLIPGALLIYIQSSGEEVAFRGYLVQQLGARFGHALVWGFLPAFLFGLMHYAETVSVEFGLYYVAATTLFGLAAAVTVWRTGSLATAMGLHVGNNLVAFMFVAPDETLASTQLWLWSSEHLLTTAALDIAILLALLVYVASPWTPFPRETALFGRRRNEIRAAP